LEVCYIQNFLLRLEYEVGLLVASRLPEFIKVFSFYVVCFNEYTVSVIADRVRFELHFNAKGAICTLSTGISLVVVLDYNWVREPSNY
jgi:hypothetical protein